MKKKLFPTVLVLLFLFFGSQANAQEAKFYALFVTKFVDYIKWPDAAPNQKVVIGVWGNSQVKEELTHFAAAKGNIEVLQLSNLADAAKCNLLFLPKENAKEFEALKSSIGTNSVLLITENEGYAEKGAAISFYLEGSKLKFKLNKSTIESKKIKVSSALMAMGTVI